MASHAQSVAMQRRKSTTGRPRPVQVHSSTFCFFACGLYCSLLCKGSF